MLLLDSCLQTCMTYTIAECRVNELLMMAEELPETCRVSSRSKFGKLLHLVGFIIKKFVTMHGHMNVKLSMECSVKRIWFYFFFILSVTSIDIIT